MPLPRTPPLQVRTPIFTRSRAFTLIELLTVIAIIGILAAIIIPTVGRVRETARASTCLSNMRSIGVAVMAYAGDNKNATPTGFGGHSLPGGQPKSWYLQIAPYLGGELVATPGGESRTRQSLRILVCPSSVRAQRGETDVPWDSFTTSRSPNIADYGYNWAVNNFDPTTASRYSKLVLTKFTSPVTPSDTPLLAEMVNFNNFIPQTFGQAAPASDEAAFDSSPQRFTQRHGGGGNVLFFDGHVERFTYAELAARATRNGRTAQDFVEGK